MQIVRKVLKIKLSIGDPIKARAQTCDALYCGGVCVQWHSDLVTLELPARCCLHCNSSSPAPQDGVSTHEHLLLLPAQQFESMQHCKQTSGYHIGGKTQLHLCVPRVEASTGPDHMQSILTDFVKDREEAALMQVKNCNLLNIQETMPEY